ncbi:MAG TPA: hypothetical protein VJ951_08005 [Bacteroidales bacterium]|nr:hypothetical protein [Bacteroidales bacterium]
MKKAILVEYNFLTRIVIDEKEENVEKIVEKSKQKILDKVHNELAENLCEWNDDEEIPHFNNNNLASDFSEIKNFEPPVTISKSYNPNLYMPFVIYIGSKLYFYASQKDHDEDFERLKTIVPKFYFIN